MRQRSENLAVWLESLRADKGELDTHDIAQVVAQQHHDFEYIHPFADTNGRTGRVLDHFMIWVTFDLAGETLGMSPFIEYFPSEKHEDEYYEGLQEADAGYFGRLSDYYADRIEQAVTAAEHVSSGEEQES
ncbi:MAG: Fic family protein [Trueperaceae bacterium]